MTFDLSPFTSDLSPSVPTPCVAPSKMFRWYQHWINVPVPEFEDDDEDEDEDD